MKTLFACAADDLVAMKFYQAAANNELWRMDITDLHYISISKDTFPAIMRQRATYWVNQKEGKHKPPSQAFKDAQKLNWALHQLEGIKGQLGHLSGNLPLSARLSIRSGMTLARQHVDSAIVNIRAQNFAKTGKPPKSVLKEMAWYMVEGVPLPERLAIYLKKEKDNVQL